MRSSPLNMISVTDLLGLSKSAPSFCQFIALLCWLFCLSISVKYMSRIYILGCANFQKSNTTLLAIQYSCHPPLLSWELLRVTRKLQTIYQVRIRILIRHKYPLKSALNFLGCDEREKQIPDCWSYRTFTALTLTVLRREFKSENWDS
jgi:hypothetical protein